MTVPLGRLFPLRLLLPWLVPAGLAVGGLVYTGTPVRDIAAYAVYFALAVVLPGTLVHRGLRGSRGNWPEDLGLGAATGMVTLLAGWAVAAATGWPLLLPAGPVLIVALFLAVPRLRRHWRMADPAPLPLRWSWIVAGALSVVVLSAYAWWRVTPLPPVTADYYRDLLYHLALVHEMTRSMPFQVPQLAGDPLRYHFLADADMASGSMLTGIAPATVLLRLWLVPVVGTAVVVAAALVRDLTGRWWAGALGGSVAVLGVPLTWGAPVDPPGGSALVPASPSQTYALPLFGLLLTVVVAVLRGEAPRRSWWLVFPLALACAGAKSSTLPPLLAGLLLVLLFSLLSRLWSRHGPATSPGLTKPTPPPELPGAAAPLGLPGGTAPLGLSGPAAWLGPVGLAGLVGAAMLVGLKLFAGGGAGSIGLQPLAVLHWFAPYRQTLGRSDVIDGDRLLPLGVDRAGTAGLLFVAGLIGWCLLAQAPRLLGLLTLARPGTRNDPVNWLLAGLTGSGLGAAWLLWHPSASQIYFYLGVVPFGVLLTVRLLASVARGWRPVLGGLLAGGLWAAVAPGVGPPAAGERSSLRAWSLTLATPMLRTAVVVVVVVALALLIWRRRAWRALPVALIAAVLGASAGGAVPHAAPAGSTAADRVITRDEMTAALWLDRHAGPDDVVATNVHCRSTTDADCDARAFWVAGLAGRRVVMESWGYTDQAVAADGVGGRRYYAQPAPYPDRFSLNQRVFALGRPTDVAALKDGWRVRWLLADSRAAGGVAPDLARVAVERYRSGPVTIFELA